MPRGMEGDVRGSVLPAIRRARSFVEQPGPLTMVSHCQPWMCVSTYTLGVAIIAPAGRLVEERHGFGRGQSAQAIGFMSSVQRGLSFHAASYRRQSKTKVLWLRRQYSFVR